jgi:uracil-DNA glycosylase
MLIGQLAGATVRLIRHCEKGTVSTSLGRNVTTSVDHWKIECEFELSKHVPFKWTPLNKPVDVSDNIEARGYYKFNDDNMVYCISVQDNTNFLCRRTSLKRIHTEKKLTVKSLPVFVGNCFSVPPGVAVPSSLKNMYTELKNDIDGFEKPKHGHLLHWAEQGVLLLNTSLTVRAGEANSHAKYGWSEFTDAIMKAINQHTSHVIFLLWGAHAQKKGDIINIGKHHVLKSSHPSGLSAHRGFIGCKHFGKANEILKKHGKQPIDWQV